MQKILKSLNSHLESLRHFYLEREPHTCRLVFWYLVVGCMLPTVCRKGFPKVAQNRNSAGAQGSAFFNNTIYNSMLHHVPCN